MNHPFFDNRKLVLLYFAIWIVIAAVHFALLIANYNMQIGSALLDSLVYNLLFSILGIPVWYIVSNSKRGKYAAINQVINHVTSASIILLIWISSSTAILKSFISEASYTDYLQNSQAWHIISGLFFYSILVLIYYIIRYYRDLQEQSAREARLNEIVRQAALDNLRSQINPHFLFNSLNSVSSLTITSPEKAQAMIIKLSDFLRYSISNSENDFTSLQSEIENIKRYLDIEEIRFGSRLKQEYHISDECLAKKIPSMMLQPLYENAVKHGVYESTEPITIITECHAVNNELLLKVTNDFDPKAKPRKGSGIGLNNIRERLKLIYGSPDFLRTQKDANTFTATLHIPQKDFKP